MPRTKQFNKQEVLKMAMELFWEKGFHATSINDLVAHLGINRASIYDTYGGKQELFNSAFDQYQLISRKTLDDLLTAEVTVKQGFLNLFHLAIQQALTDDCHKGCFVVNTITELVPGDAVIEHKLMENSATVEHVFADYIQKGIENGELNIAKNPKVLASTIFALYSGLMVLAKIEQNETKLKDVVATGLSVLD
ncbi:MAG: TetR/AcrR family transcriptional regulator [Maribacter sp.]